MRAQALGSVLLIPVTFTLLSICPFNAFGATEKILHSFNGTFAHGRLPQSALVSDVSGTLYGTTFSGGTYSLGTVYKLTPTSKGGWTQTVIYNFQGGSDGSYPTAAVVVDGQGNVYGTTGYGGGGACGGYSTGCGVVFKLSPGYGGGYTESVIHTFQGGGSDGALPEAGLVLDSAGDLYGATGGGGSTVGSGGGTVFKLTPTSSGGWTESILHTFGSGNDGANPNASLTFDSVGRLYGTTTNGGTTLKGTVFELSPSSEGTWTETVLYNFAGGTDGSWPRAPLIFDTTGNLYSTTSEGGTIGCGTVFELKPSGTGGWTESILHSFGSVSGDGGYPLAGLTFDQAGNLYGTTNYGGGSSCAVQMGSGVVFQLSPPVSGGQWTENIIYSFGSNSYVGNPYAGVLLQGGALYGTSSQGGAANLGSVFKLTQSTGGSWTKKTIYWFQGSSDGGGPQSNLIADSLGNFYGTTIAGGKYSQGTVFKLSPRSGGGWTTTQIYAFKGGADGAGPTGSLVLDTVGNLYGTTMAGGAGICGSSGSGTVFKLAPSTGGKWIESVLHSFIGGADGVAPLVGLAFTHGNLLGTTLGGGGNGTGCYPFNGCGVVFELTPASGGKWNETIVHTFTGGTDGGVPGYGLLSLDASGNLYGTTLYTGCDGCLNDFPTVFELSPTGFGGWTISTIYEFVDFGLPEGGLVFDSAGNIYGTTGGAAYGSLVWGSVFELTKVGGTWSETVLYGFSGGTDGAYANGGVTFDVAGNLYGTTSGGGNSGCGSGTGCGVLYKLAPGSGGSWNFSVLHTFNGPSTDGLSPLATVTIDSAGHLYGTTASGGAYGGPGTSSTWGYGTVYEVTP